MLDSAVVQDESGEGKIVWVFLPFYPVSFLSLFPALRQSKPSSDPPWSTSAGQPARPDHSLVSLFTTYPTARTATARAVPRDVRGRAGDAPLETLLADIVFVGQHVLPPYGFVRL